MKIAIIGTGGVGGYFGGKMANAGFNVTFLARGEHYQAIRANGLTVKSVLGDFHLDRVQVTDNIREIGPADLIILALKAWQIKELVPALATLIDKGTVIFPLQNKKEHTCFSKL